MKCIEKFKYFILVYIKKINKSCIFEKKQITNALNQYHADHNI